MTDRHNTLAELADITCPLCGESGFDAAGFVGHIDRWCERVDEAREELAAYHRKTAEIARAALRARAAQQEAKRS